MIENEAVDPEAIAEAGFQATAHASEDSELILALEDSTTLAYKHSARSELGDPGGPEDSRTKGFWAHSVMLLDAETERTLGLIDQQRWILLTTESVESFEDCRKVLRFYELRWRIEEFHKAWKTGRLVRFQTHGSPRPTGRLEGMGKVTTQR